MEKTKFVLWPVVDKVPARVSVLYTSIKISKRVSLEPLQLMISRAHLDIHKILCPASYGWAWE